MATQPWEIALLAVLQMVSRMASVIEELQRDVYDREFANDVPEHPPHRDSPVVTHSMWLMMLVQQIEQISATAVDPETRGGPRTERSRSRSRSACREWLIGNLDAPEASGARPSGAEAPPGGEGRVNLFSRHTSSS